MMKTTLLAAAALLALATATPARSDTTQEYFKGIALTHCYYRYPDNSDVRLYCIRRAVQGANDIVDFSRRHGFFEMSNDRLLAMQASGTNMALNIQLFCFNHYEEDLAEQAACLRRQAQAQGIMP